MIHIQCDVVVRNAHFVAGTGIDIVIRALFDKEIVESFAVQALSLIHI